MPYVKGMENIEIIREGDKVTNGRKTGTAESGEYTAQVAGGNVVCVTVRWDGGKQSCANYRRNLRKVAPPVLTVGGWDGADEVTDPPRPSSTSGRHGGPSSPAAPTSTAGTVNTRTAAYIARLAPGFTIVQTAAPGTCAAPERPDPNPDPGPGRGPLTSSPPMC